MLYNGYNNCLISLKKDEKEIGVIRALTIPDLKRKGEGELFFGEMDPVKINKDDPFFSISIVTNSDGKIFKRSIKEVTFEERFLTEYTKVKYYFKDAELGFQEMNKGPEYYRGTISWKGPSDL